MRNERPEQEMKTVALFGGSFNPPHPGHFDMARCIYEILGVDEVWFLFSENWQKDVAQYASAAHRMEMGRILAAHYPDMPFVMSGIQDELGTHKTYEVLCALKDRFPDTRFIWVMGADNLVNFHTWEHFEDIIDNFPVAVVNRPPYTEQVRTSYTALTYPHLRIDHAKDMAGAKNGWCFLDNPAFEMSSSNLLARLRNGETTFDGPFQEVADYIRQQKIYGISGDATKQDRKDQRDVPAFRK